MLKPTGFLLDSRSNQSGPEKVLSSEATPIRAQSSRLVEIDYLRAYAIGFVVFLHVVGAYMGMSPKAEKFFGNVDLATGVDIFFAISGYVIARSLRVFWVENSMTLREKLERTLVFYQKRFVRLWPSAMFWLVVGVALSFAFHKNGFWPNYTESLRSLIAGAVYFSNFQQYYSPSDLGYFWTLSVEWQFYLLLPLILVFVRSNAWRVATLLLALAASVILQPGGAGWWMFRFDGIVFGILVFVVVDLIGVRVPVYASLDGAPGRVAMLMLALAAIAVLPVAAHPQRLGNVFSSALAALLVVLASRDRGYISTLGLAPFVRWLGSRSYSVYLCHFPCLLLVRSIQAHYIGISGVLHPTFGQAAAALAGTFAAVAIASELSFRYLERPSHSASHALRYGAAST